MFVPCTTLLYDSAAATWTIKLSTTLLSISCAIHMISFLMMPSLVCGLFSQTLSFSTPLENSQAGWDLGNRMAKGCWLMWNESVPWELMPEVFKCSVQGGGLKSGGASFLEQPPFLACLPISLTFWYPGLIQGSDCFWAQGNQRQKIKDKKLYLINHWRDKTCSHK